MGYYATQTDSHVVIDKCDFPKVIKAIHALAKTAERDGGGYSNGKKHYSWIGNAFDKIQDIEELFQYWRWEAYFDYEGSICDLNFSGEKLGDDEFLLSAIAPFVKDGSYIQMAGEDNEIWRWKFANGEMKAIYPKIIWEE